jgi:hypothetical protein
MKKFVLMLAGLGIIAAIVYLMGTRGGRARRDALLSRTSENAVDGVAPEIDLREQAHGVAEDAEDEVDLHDDAGDDVGALN